jgi:hypothetical protein
VYETGTRKLTTGFAPVNIILSPELSTTKYVWEISYVEGPIVNEYEITYCPDVLNVFVQLLMSYVSAGAPSINHSGFPVKVPVYSSVNVADESATGETKLPLHSIERSVGGVGGGPGILNVTLNPPSLPAKPLLYWSPPLPPFPPPKPPVLPEDDEPVSPDVNVRPVVTIVPLEFAGPPELPLPPEGPP